MLRRHHLSAGVALAAVLATGSGHAQSTPPASSPSAKPPSDAANASPESTFQEVFDRIQSQYVKQTDPKKTLGDALNGMLTSLDPHSYYMTPEQWKETQVQNSGTFGGIGTEITLASGYVKIVSPFDGTPAANAGLRPNDLITAIDGQTTKGLTLEEAIKRLRGEPKTTVKLAIQREGETQPVDVTLTREIVHVQVVKNRLFDDVGYIRMTSFTDQSDPGLRQALQTFKTQAGDKLKALILDLRNNPGGLFGQALLVANDFMRQGEIVAIRGRQPGDNQQWDVRPNQELTDLPLVLMINAGTASASEILSGALQDNHRAVLLGVRSFGKGSVQLLFPLNNGGAMRMTTALYYTPSGRSIQDDGIVPDVEVAENRGGSEEAAVKREADLKGALANGGHINTAEIPPVRNDLPTIAAQIPKLPPENWPKLDPNNPATDFQLQQALVLARAMEAQQTAAH